MNRTEVIAATGTGRWGLPYEVALATVTRELRQRYQSGEKITLTSELRFRTSGSTNWQDRHFRTEEERDEFIRRAFSEISLRPLIDPRPAPRSHILSPIVGEQLSAITFVMDYVQIVFHAHSFSCYAWPVVWTEDRRRAHGEAGYCDALCALIMKVVTRFEEYLDVGLAFEFDEGSSIEMPIIDEDLVEAVMYQGPENVWNVWG